MEKRLEEERAKPQGFVLLRVYPMPYVSEGLLPEKTAEVMKRIS